MPMWNFLSDSLKALGRLSPQRVRALGQLSLTELVERESHRAKVTVEALVQRYPSAGPRELTAHLVDEKKQLASMVGGVTGVLGLVAVPVDLLGMVYLELALMTEVATVFKVSLKSARARQELVDVFSDANGIGPLKRSSPRVLGSLAAKLLAKGGLQTLSRAVPFVAAPISAYLNHQHIQRIGDRALRHYGGWGQAQEKARRAGGPRP